MPPRTLLLVSPPVLHGRDWAGNRIGNRPHLASLAGSARGLADVLVLELDLPGDDELAPLLELLDAVLDPSVALVGISCWTSQHYLGSLAVARRVRLARPDLPIVVGGHHATALPSDFPPDLFDWVVTGDGEHPLRELCEQWPRRPDQQQIVDGAPYQQVVGHIDWTRYGRPGDRSRALWVAATRGCSFKCRYCVEPNRAGAISGYSVEDTLGILDGLVETHAPSVIAFSDALFGADRRWTTALLAGIEERDLPLMFWAETRADLMTPELLDAFRRCRFMLDFGLDTGSAVMAARMEKAANPARYLQRSREILRHADAIGLHHGVYMIFNYPGETPDTADESRRWIDELALETGPTSGWLSCQSYFVLPGTPVFARMAEDAEEHGTEVRHPAWWREEGNQHALATDVLPSRDWKGRESELQGFWPWNLSVNQRWVGRYTPEVLAFRQAFFVG